MSFTRTLSLAPLALLLTGPAGCFLVSGDDLNNVEMREALDEVVLEGQGQAVENEIVEITTDFTIGEGVAQAAAALRDAIASQIPCSTVTVADDQLTLDFGGLDDSCVYNGHTFAGVVTLTISHDQASNKITVDHTYQDLSNGVVTLNGSKVVDWTSAARHIVTRAGGMATRVLACSARTMGAIFMKLGRAPTTQTMRTGILEADISAPAYSVNVR